MRIDINIDTQNSNDINVTDISDANIPIGSFTWGEEKDTYVLGIVSLPNGYNSDRIYEEGIKVSIPYNPIYKYLAIEFTLSDGTLLNINKYNNGPLFYVYSDKEKLNCTELFLINESTYILKADENGELTVWSGTRMDFLSGNANEQNRDLLLQCMPGNNYRYPISGVGLIKYLHGSIENSDLRSVLQSEFEEDDVTVKDASFDSSTGKINLDLDYTKANENV